MSLLSDIKNLLSRYLKNPVLIIAGSYILWKFINSQKKKPLKEWFSERITVIDDSKENKHSIIFDNKTNKFILIKNNKVYSSDKKEDLIKMI